MTALRVCFLVLLAAVAYAPLRASEVIDPAAVDPAWRELFDALARQGAVRASFIERRWFSVRKEPVVLRGELRHDRERGLSLRYTAPEEQLMIVDAQGIVLRDARGRSRTLKSDPRAPQVDALLLHVLRFDLAALHAAFEIRGLRTDAGWQLEFTPRTEALARSAGRMLVQGEGEAVRRLEFQRGPKQRVEVGIESAETGATFSDEELRRYFR